jgi:acetyl-CoA acetyltransferase
MLFQNTFIPYGGYWSTPFCKWQGSFANLHPIRLAAAVTCRALAERQIGPHIFTGLYLGTTVPSPAVFYGAPWVAGLIGAGDITGPTLAQACATSARVLGSAAYELESGREIDGRAKTLLCLTADRTSNGPHLVYPNPLAPGGRNDTEDWVWDNFNRDPLAAVSMIETAENVARDYGISTAEQHEVALLRYNQYQQALADDAAFQRRYMVTPVEVNPSGRHVVATVRGDEGVFATTAAGLERLKPVRPGGTVTYGGQTFPADGNAGMIVCGREQAQELSRDPAIPIQLLAFAEGRAEKGYMPKANTPAVRRVLQQAGLDLAEIQAVKTHNPFAVNDCVLNRDLGIPLDKMNNYGSSLVWGHPQGPTGMRLMMELIEELALSGGGYGLFTGCAAGDTAAAMVVKVG